MEKQPATIQEIREILKEAAEERKKTEIAQQETQAELKEMQKESRIGFKELREAQKKTEAGFKELQRVQKETQKELGGLGYSLGKIAEY